MGRRTQQSRDEEQAQDGYEDTSNIPEEYEEYMEMERDIRGE